MMRREKMRPIELALVGLYPLIDVTIRRKTWFCVLFSSVYEKMIVYDLRQVYFSFFPVVQ